MRLIVALARTFVENGWQVRLRVSFYSTDSHDIGRIEPACLFDLDGDRAQDHRRRRPILLRADSHYCGPEVLDWCRASGLDYILGVAPTTTLRRHVEDLEASMKTRFEAAPSQRANCITPKLAFNAIPLILNSALGGLGLAYLPEDLVQAHVAAGRLVRVLADWSPLMTGYHLYYPNRQPSPAFALLVKGLRYHS